MSIEEMMRLTRAMRTMRIFYKSDETLAKAVDDWCLTNVKGYKEQREIDTEP